MNKNNASSNGSDFADKKKGEGDVRDYNSIAVGGNEMDENTQNTKAGKVLNEQVKQVEHVVAMQKEESAEGGVGAATAAAATTKAAAAPPTPAAASNAEVIAASASSSVGGTGGGDRKLRRALRVEVLCPGILGPLVVYTAHLDAFAGRTARVHQLQPVLEDAQVGWFGWLTVCVHFH